MSEKKAGANDRLSALRHKRRIRKAAEVFLDANEKPDVEEAFDDYFAYLDKSSENAEVMRQYNAVWDSIETMEDLPWPDEQELRSQWPRLPAMAIAASLLIAIVSAVLVVTVNDFGRDEVQRVVHSTERGNQHAVILDDGSKVSLGGDARLIVEYGQNERSVHLVHGDAFVNVAKDETRPFVVKAGKVSVRAIGTAFNVSKGTEEVYVGVSEGTVAVVYGPEQDDFVHLIGGQQVKYMPDQGVSSVKEVEPGDVGAWRRGELILNDVSLAFAAESINRYFEGEIRIRDKRVANLRASGVVDIYSPGEWLESLEVILPVSVSQSDPGDYVLDHR